MAKPKGSPKTGGRARGVPNKINADLRAMVLNALSEAGGEAYLQRQANENPAAFMTLLGKVLPMQVTGGGGGAVTIQVVTGVPRDEQEEGGPDAGC